MSTIYSKWRRFMLHDRRLQTFAVLAAGALLGYLAAANPWRASPQASAALPAVDKSAAAANLVAAERTAPACCIEGAGKAAP
jgi:hypothetical protein